MTRSTFKARATPRSTFKARATQRALARVLLALGLAGTALMTPAIADDGLPSRLTAEYEVIRGAINLGTIKKTLKRDGDIYRVSSTVEPNPLIKMIAGGEANEEAVFQVTANGLRSVFYTESRTGKPSHSVNFDWTRRTLTFEADGKITRTINVPNIDTVDLSSLPFYLMLKPLKELAGTSIGIVNSKHVGEYTFLKPIAETIETDDGPVDTWRIEKTRNDSATRSIKVWVDPNRGNLPVRIQQLKDDTTTTFNLKTTAGM